jgi:ribokinase
MADESTISRLMVAVIGHIEWAEFAVVDRVPRPGDIVHADAPLEEPAGGGAVAAVQLARLAGACTLFTALGDDERGRRSAPRLAALGVRVEGAARREPQRRCFVYVDGAGERTITTLGSRLGPSIDDPLPWEDLARADAVFFTAGDRGALEAGRQARVLVATTRVVADLVEFGVPLDAIVGSGNDPAERYAAGQLHPPPGLVVLTDGARGGSWATADGRSGAFAAASPPGPSVDAYGCGDSFAAGLTFALGAGYPLDRALGVAARCGAVCLTGRGPYEHQLGADDLLAEAGTGTSR